MGITDQESCVIYEPKTFTRLSQVQLPNEIALDEKTSAYAGARTIVCTIYGSNSRTGIFGSTSLYFIKCSPIADLLKFAAEQLSPTPVVDLNIKEHNLYHIAMKAKKWGLEAWYIKYILELMIQDAEQAQKKRYLGSSKVDTLQQSSQSLKDSRISVEEKKKILNDLCIKLENPALVWTATKSLSEQRYILRRVADFLLHFPSPDSNFWKTEKQMQLSHNLREKFRLLSETNSDKETSYWYSLLETVSGRRKEDILPHDILDKMTVLNLSVVPTLAKSISLSKEQIDSLLESIDSFSDPTREKESNIEQLEGNKLTTSLIKQMSDIELDSLAKEKPLDVLKILCQICGLDSFINYIEGVQFPDTKQSGKFCEAQSASILGYSVPPFDGINPVLLDNFERSNDELLSEFDPTCMKKPLTAREAVSSRISFLEAEDSAEFIDIEDSLSFSNFGIEQGCIYFELICSLLFNHSQHPALVAILVSMIYRCHVEKIKQAIKKEGEQTSKLTGKEDVSSVSEQVRKHQLLMHKQKMAHLQRLLSCHGNIRRFYAARALENIYSIHLNSDMIRFEKNIKDTTIYLPNQIETIALLLLWNDQVLSALKLLLSYKMEQQVIEVLNHYVLDYVKTNQDEQSQIPDYQSIKLSHEEQCELMHVLLRYCVETGKNRTQEQSPLWKLIWNLIPMSYNAFHFLKEFEKIQYSASNENQANMLQERELECDRNSVGSMNNSSTRKKKAQIFAAENKENTISIQELRDNLRSKFITNSSLNKLF